MRSKLNVTIPVAVLSCLLCSSLQAAPPGSGQQGAGPARPVIRTPAVATVTVRRTWTMAFVVVAHSADDITTDEFAAGVAKVDRMRLAVPGAFRAATEGLGRLETSDRVFVVQNDTWSRPKANPAWQDLYGRVRWTLKDVYEETGDVWDFVAIYMADDRVDSFGGNAALIQSEDASMTGLAAYDHTRRVGSDGRLLCVGLVNKVEDMLPLEDIRGSEGMHVLLHETIGHHYGMYWRALNPPGERMHFHWGIEGPAFTILYARPWVKVDDTHFKVVPPDDQRFPGPGDQFVHRFHPWMLYIMGLKRADEVPSRIMKVHTAEPPAHRYEPTESTGTFEWIDLQDVFGFGRTTRPVLQRQLPFNRIFELLRSEGLRPQHQLPHVGPIQ